MGSLDAEGRVMAYKGCCRRQAGGSGGRMLVISLLFCARFVYLLFS